MSLLSELRRRNVLRMAVLYGVAAWLIMQVVEVLMSLVGLPLWTGQVTLVVLVIGFPIALAFSWFYELTPEGVQLDSDIDTTVSDARVSGRRMDFIVISLLAAALLVFSYDKWLLRDDVAINLSVPNSVAVLPFKNMSGNPDNEYFSDGLTETLLHALAQFPDLKVPARTSSFFFKGQDIDVREIARQLGVSKVLEGSVQRSGGKLRVVAQLIEAETGFHLWSNTYDRDMNDVFAVQDDIATSVALAMKITLAGGGKIETVSTDNVAAFEKYLQGLQQKNINSHESLLLGEIAFKTALALDPDFYEARLELAHTYIDQQLAGVIPFGEAGERVAPLLDQLIEERPDDGLVLMIANYVDFLRTAIRGEGVFDIEPHIARLGPAIARAPNEARLYTEMAHSLSMANRRDEGLEWLDRGIEVDPLDSQLHLSRGSRLMSVGDLDGAQASFEKAIELNPKAPMAHVYASEIFRHRKQHSESFAMMRKVIDLSPVDHEGPALMALRLYTFGLMEEGDKYWQRASAIAPGNAYVKKTRLYRLLLLDDHTEAREMSESLLRDDIDVRGEAHSFAVTVFLSTMIEAGRIEETLAVLDELWPGVTSSDFEPVGEKEVTLQGYVVLAMSRSRPTEETLSALDKFTSGREETARFFLWPRNRASVAMARGQTEKAVQLALKSLEEGLELGDAIPYQIFRYSEHLLALAEEPAVTARLAELDAEAKQAGEEISAYIKEHNLQL